MEQAEAEIKSVLDEAITHASGRKAIELSHVVLGHFYANVAIVNLLCKKGVIDRAEVADHVKATVKALEAEQVPPSVLIHLFRTLTVLDEIGRGAAPPLFPFR